jgi:hypothetical protein
MFRYSWIRLYAKNRCERHLPSTYVIFFYPARGFLPTSFKYLAAPYFYLLYVWVCVCVWGGGCSILASCRFEWSCFHTVTQLINGSWQNSLILQLQRISNHAKSNNLKNWLTSAVSEMWGGLSSGEGGGGRSSWVEGC